MSDQPTARDAVRTILHLNEDSVQGKTVLQKLVYLTCQRESADVRFEPYFYGPFSRDIENAVELMEMAGEVEETTTNLGVASSGWPIRLSTYRLTEDGAKRALDDSQQHPAFFEAASKVLGEAKSLDPSLGPQPLSVAAKVHFLLTSRGERLTTDQVTSYAKDLGWELSDADVEKADALLDKLGMIDA